VPPLFPQSLCKLKWDAVYHCHLNTAAILLVNENGKSTKTNRVLISNLVGWRGLRPILIRADDCRSIIFSTVLLDLINLVNWGRETEAQNGPKNYCFNKTKLR
jgi:hypothetical protein